MGIKKNTLKSIIVLGDIKMSILHEPLKPCPFCAAPEPVVELNNKARILPHFWVSCGCCRASTSQWLQFEIAVIAWNRRGERSNTVFLPNHKFARIRTIVVLSPCPFCSVSEEVALYSRPRPGLVAYWVECRACGNRTGDWDRDDKAIAFWQRRDTVASQEELREAGYSL